MPIFLAWLQFLVCALVIAGAGPSLSKNGDIIADKTGLSGSWVGLVLLATVTSLPELVTGISSVTAAHVPNIAVGDVLGSCVFNLLILVIVDLIYRRQSLYQSIDQGQILAAAFGVMLIGLAGLSLLIAQQGFEPAVWHIGIYTPVLIGVYAVAMRSVFIYERRKREAFVEAASERYPEVTLRQAITRYAIAAAAILAAGIWLPFAAADLAEVMGWRTSFVGSSFVAAATSLPELVVTIAAVRLGALDLAIAGLLGSNLFDILILGIDDLFYTQGPLLSTVSPVHALTAASAVVMSGIVIVNLMFRPRRRVFRTVGWGSLALFVIYLGNSYLVFLRGD